MTGLGAFETLTLWAEGRIELDPATIDHHRRGLRLVEYGRLAEQRKQTERRQQAEWSERTATE